MCIADRLFAWNEETEDCGDAAAEADMVALLRAASVPFESIGWDSYDGSLEIDGVPPEWRMSCDLQDALWREGFVKVFVNHTDFWETHYGYDNPSRGWRVSYPHKRPVDDGQLWVGAPVPTWPQKWFRSWWPWRKPYAAVKPDNN